jgi:ribosomal protein L37E
MSAPSFTCPRCGRTSHHPDDVREGYCGACHAWTRDESVPHYLTDAQAERRTLDDG